MVQSGDQRLDPAAFPGSPQKCRQVGDGCLGNQNQGHPLIVVVPHLCAVRSNIGMMHQWHLEIQLNYSKIMYQIIFCGGTLFEKYPTSAFILNQEI